MKLDLEFTGRFPKLADLFAGLKRYVRTVNQRIDVNGRLLTIDSLNFASDQKYFPGIRAEATATVYLSPLSQGPTAGATPQGPGQSRQVAATPPTGAPSP